MNLVHLSAQNSVRANLIKAPSRDQKEALIRCKWNQTRYDFPTEPRQNTRVSVSTREAISLDRIRQPKRNLQSVFKPASVSISAFNIQRSGQDAFIP
jgi:hypothetical protein